MNERERMNVTEHIVEKLRHRQHRSEITEQNQSVTSAQFVSVFCIRCARFICENCCCCCRLVSASFHENHFQEEIRLRRGKPGSAQFMFFSLLNFFVNPIICVFFSV